MSDDDILLFTVNLWNEKMTLIWLGRKLGSVEFVRNFLNKNEFQMSSTVKRRK